MVGTEEMPPGNVIPTHKHLYEDEVIFVHKGAVRVTLAGCQYNAGTGATVFIPHGNWIGVENASRQSAMILFFFNKSAFEQRLRALSSRPGEPFTMPAPENGCGRTTVSSGDEGLMGKESEVSGRLLWLSRQGTLATLVKNWQG
jgi:hypothetical protein